MLWYVILLNAFAVSKECIEVQTTAKTSQGLLSYNIMLLLFMQPFDKDM